jgi:hypothetical protein
LPEAGQFEEWVVADIIGYPETSMVTRRVDDDEVMSAKLAGISKTNPVVTLKQ